jgi:acyl carrier protein
MVKNVEETVRKIISANCEGKNANEIGLSESLQDLGINSISFIKIVIALEKEFGIEVEDENLNPDDFQTIQSIINYVEARIAAVNK